MDLATLPSCSLRPAYRAGRPSDGRRHATAASSSRVLAHPDGREPPHAQNHAQPSNNLHTLHAATPHLRVRRPQSVRRVWTANKHAGCRLITNAGSSRAWTTGEND
eukprot:scaffold90764_cov32-Tisochrysis_lutea.AAC.1